VTVLDTANPNAQSAEMVPLDLLVKGGKIHERLWTYWLKKGPHSLPSKPKLVEKNLAWVPTVFEEMYKSQQTCKTAPKQPAPPKP